jgi:hypothetical protein
MPISATKIRKPCCVALFLGLAGLALTGCSAPLGGAELAAPRSTGNHSQVIFSTPEITAAYAGIDDAQLPEFSRRDAQMAIASNEPLLATTQWPQPERTSIEQARYIRLVTSPDQFIIYRRPPRYLYQRDYNDRR